MTTIVQSNEQYNSSLFNVLLWAFHNTNMTQDQIESFASVIHRYVVSSANPIIERERLLRDLYNIGQKYNAFRMDKEYCSTQEGKSSFVKAAHIQRDAFYSMVS
jgi:hypothetical protein